MDPKPKARIAHRGDDNRMSNMDQAAKNTPGLVLVTDMPDIASRELRNPEETLDWVGMGEVHQPLRIRDGSNVREVQARVQIYVDLADPQAKGIHMSRLYLILDEHPGDATLERRRVEAAARVAARIAPGTVRPRLCAVRLRLLPAPPGSRDGQLGLERLSRIHQGHPPRRRNTCRTGGRRALFQYLSMFRRAVPTTRSAAVRSGPSAAPEKWTSQRSGNGSDPNSPSWRRPTPSAASRAYWPSSTTGWNIPDHQPDRCRRGGRQTPVQTAVKREDEHGVRAVERHQPHVLRGRCAPGKNRAGAEPRLTDYWVARRAPRKPAPANAVAVLTKGVDRGYLPIP